MSLGGKQGSIDPPMRAAFLKITKVTPPTCGGNAPTNPAETIASGM
jgi:hypothetical protein